MRVLNIQLSDYLNSEPAANHYGAHDINDLHIPSMLNRLIISELPQPLLIDWIEGLAVLATQNDTMAALASVTSNLVVQADQEKADAYIMPD